MFVVTALVVATKLALETPDGTTMLPGTWACVSLLDSSTLAPPDGAALVSETVPVELLPPTTVVGLTVTAWRAAGLVLGTVKAINDVLACAPVPQPGVAVTAVCTVLTILYITA